MRQNTQKVGKLFKKKRVTKKQVGHGENNKINQVKTTNFEDLVTFFDIKDPEYFKAALNDAIGLYSLVNWKGPSHNTYESNTNNIESINIIPYHENKTYKPMFKKGSIHQSAITNTSYEYVSTFIKEVKFIEHPDDFVSISCAIFKKKDTKEYLVMFIWGYRPNFHNPGYKIVLDKMYKYIVEKSNDASHILLCGFSMGGNLAHHMALRFISQNPEKNIYVATMGSGGTLYDAEKSLFECKLYGKFISISLLFHKDYTIFKPDEYGYIKYSDLYSSMDSNMSNIDYSIYPSKLNGDSDSLRTVKTMLLSINYGLFAENKKMIDVYKIFANYDFHKIRNIPFFDIKWIKDYDRPLHNYVLYRMFMGMLINGDNEYKKERK